jgi:L,D-peptidoglycan transpeptidase YkuD (ErfK/YbiS/YcfS/YnhG family)
MMFFEQRLFLIVIMLTCVVSSRSDSSTIAYLKWSSGFQGQLIFANRSLDALIGRNGVSNNKHEGDGTTPSGFLAIRRLLYRPDRLITPPVTSLRCEPLHDNDGWCDDPNDVNYNRQVQLPYAASHEKLWREDHLYDIVGVLGYNDDPIVPGRGSAIFLHIHSPEGEPTEGCISLSIDDLQWVLHAGLTAIYVLQA